MSVLYIRDDSGKLIPLPAIRGKDGKSAYEYARSAGYTGTEEEFAEKLASESVGVPSYWQTALDTGVNSINLAIESAGRNKSAFLWYTDTHWGYGSGMSPKLLKYLQDNTAMTKINFGGDFANGYEYPDTGKTGDDWLALMRDSRKPVLALENHHSVIGNHDANGSNGDIPYLNGNSKRLYGFVMAPEESSDIVRGGDFYYYIDEPNEKTRYLYLNTSFCWDEGNKFEVGQGAFVAEALSSTPAGWHIVAISHMWFMYDPKTYSVETGYLPAYCGSLLDLFDEYNLRKSGTTTIGAESVSYNFTSTAGKVEFCIGGHVHVDHDFTSTGGIPVILTETDSRHERRSPTLYRAGTTTEASVNGIIADYDAGKVSVIRIGRGTSRYVTLNSSTPGGGDPGVGDGGATSYNNVLKTVGYKTDTYVSASSGFIEKEKSGVDLTGYIPVKTGDILRFKNITIPETNSSGYDNEIYLFDSNKTGTGSGDVQEMTGSEWSMQFENGYLVQLKYGGSGGFIRINATHIDDTSIITINEEIT